MYNFFIIFMALFLSSPLSAHEDEKEIKIRGHIKHTAFEGVGYNNSYSSLGFVIYPDYIPVDNVPFFDMRAHLTNNGCFCSNLGVGFRWLDECDRRLIGVNAYYDYRDEIPTQAFGNHQIGLGFEYFTDKFDLTANLYMPVARRYHKKLVEDTTSYSKYYLSHLREGLDIEIAKWFPAVCRNLELYTALGFYYFNGKDKEFHYSDNTYGVNARIEFHHSENLWTTVGLSHDNVYNTKLLLSIKLFFPIYTKTRCQEPNNYCLKNRLSLPVRRRDIIAARNRDAIYTKPIIP